MLAEAVDAKTEAQVHDVDLCLESADSERLAQSGRPGSNRRRPAWEAGILPTELRPRASIIDPVHAAGKQP